MLEHGTREFASARAALISPLASLLFRIDGVSSVFFGPDFVTVTKKEAVPWAELKPQIFMEIMNFFGSGQPVISDAADLPPDTEILEGDDEVPSRLESASPPSCRSRQALD